MPLKSPVGNGRSFLLFGLENAFSIFLAWGVEKVAMDVLF